jgi:DHA1 family inner membrane transport protein
MLTPAVIATYVIAAATNLSISLYYFYPRHLIQLGMGPGDIGSLMSGFFWGAVLGLPLADWLMRRAGGRFVMASGLGYLVLASVDLLISTSFWPIIAGRVLLGMGWSAANVAGTVVVAAAAPAGRLGQALTLLGLSFVVGQGMAPLIASVTGSASFIPLFYVAAGVALAAMAALPVIPAIISDSVPHWPPWRRVMVPLAAVGLLAAPLLACYSLVAAATSAAGLVDAAPLFFLGLMLATVVTRLGTGRVLDLVNRSLLIGAATVLAALALALLVILVAPWQVAAAGALAGAASSIYMPSLTAMMIERSRDRVAAVTIFRMSVEVSGGLGAVGGGLLASLADYSTMFALGAVLTLVAGALVLLENATAVRSPRLEGGAIGGGED